MRLPANMRSLYIPHRKGALNVNTLDMLRERDRIRTAFPAKRLNTVTATLKVNISQSPLATKCSGVSSE